MEKMHRCEGYVEALEEERRKIQVFHRELPLCLELVTQAISTCRRQLTTTVEYFPERSECSEQTSSEGPVFEEFIPIKRSSSSEEQESPKNKERDDKAGKKTDWLRSVQLWNQDPDPSPKQDQSRKTPVIETKKTGGAFHPFQQDKGVTSAVTIPSPAQTAAASSSADTTNGRSRIEEKEGQSQRKQRRSWSPELHRRFLHALQELGGAHVATPKQIRELMKVDGLSNDEVKSHLQKYRLHTKRPNSAAHNNASPQPPQFVVVGGIWVPPEYAAMAATTRETNGGVAAKGIYAPLAAPPQLPPALMLCSQQQQQEQKQSPQSHLHSEERCFHSGDDNTHYNSPATSSSTHTTTASPAF